MPILLPPVARPGSAEYGTGRQRLPEVAGAFVGGQEIAVPVHQAPFAVLAPVGVRDADRHRLRLAPVHGHRTPFVPHRVSEVAAGVDDQVVAAQFPAAEPAGDPAERLAQLVPSPLARAPRAEEAYVAGPRPEPHVRLRVAAA